MAQQLILPLIPRGATEINNQVCVWRGEEEWTYLLGTHPIYLHKANDHRMFRLVTSMLINSGCCRVVEIHQTFGVSKSSVIRSLNKLRAGGPESFFKPRQRRRGGKVFTLETITRGQQLLDQGMSRREIAEELGIKYDTLRKAINDGRLRERRHNEAGRDDSSQESKGEQSVFRQLLDRDDDLAEDLAGKELLIGLGCVLEGKYRVDNGPELVREERQVLQGRCLGSHVHTVDGEVLAEDLPERELRLVTAGGTEGDDASAALHRCD